MKKVKKSGIANAAEAVSVQVKGGQPSVDVIDRRVRESSGEMLKRLNIELPEAVHKELKLEAVMKGVSMRQLVEEMLKARYR